MRKIVTIAVAAAMVGTPVQAASWTQGAENVRPGAFAGVRLRMRLGGEVPSRPEAALTLAPTLTRLASDGSTRMRIGEGVALNLAPGAKPSLTLAGVRADTALGLQRHGRIDADQKLGLSTVGAIAIGVGAVLAVGAVLWVIDSNTNCGIGQDPDSCS